MVVQSLTQPTPKPSFSLTSLGKKEFNRIIKMKLNLGQSLNLEDVPAVTSYALAFESVNRWISKVAQTEEQIERADIDTDFDRWKYLNSFLLSAQEKLNTCQGKLNDSIRVLGFNPLDRGKIKSDEQEDEDILGV